MKFLVMLLSNKPVSPVKFRRITACLRRMLKGYRAELLSYGLEEHEFDYSRFWDQVETLQPLIETGWFRKLWISSWASPFQIHGYLRTGEYIYFRSRNGRHFFSVSKTEWHKDTLYTASLNSDMEGRGEESDELNEEQAIAFIEASLRVYFSRK